MTLTRGSWISIWLPSSTRGALGQRNTKQRVALGFENAGARHDPSDNSPLKAQTLPQVLLAIRRFLRLHSEAWCFAVLAKTYKRVLVFRIGRLHFGGNEKPRSECCGVSSLEARLTKGEAVACHKGGELCLRFWDVLNRNAANDFHRNA